MRDLIRYKGGNNVYIFGCGRLGARSKGTDDQSSAPAPDWYQLAVRFFGYMLLQDTNEYRLLMVTRTGTAASG